MQTKKALKSPDILALAERRKRKVYIAGSGDGSRGGPLDSFLCPSFSMQIDSAAIRDSFFAKWKIIRKGAEKESCGARKAGGGGERPRANEVRGRQNERNKTEKGVGRKRREENEEKREKSNTRLSRASWKTRTLGGYSAGGSEAEESPRDEEREIERERERERGRNGKRESTRGAREREKL